jgi:DNA mismatch repair ATPase MutS
MAVQAGLAAPVRADVRAVLDDVGRPAADLALLGRVLERIERARFGGDGLRRLQARLLQQPPAPSRRIRRLVRLNDFVEARLNQIFLPLSWLLSLGTQLAFAIEDWREKHGPHVDTWNDVVAELEALASLSGYAYEHPDDPFPRIEDTGALLDGEALGHPLLPAARCVRNDVRLARPATDDEPQALVVSGSNMSGKSTLLRTVGTNAVLAFAGAPVRARALALSPLGIGASIRVQDSLQEGASRFYAEIGRLKRIVDLGRDDRPTLFLLDEILHGTNSHDRRIGAEAVVRTLLDQGALGLVTTHDLALAEMADAAGPRLANVHFEDHMEGDRIAFDYRLKPGVVTHSNALALMRAVGLDVDDEA